MRKYSSIPLAMLLVASLMAGCRDRNVSDREDGMITDPTVTTESIYTMPSTDTAPSITTAPNTDPTTETDTTDEPGEPGAPETTTPGAKGRMPGRNGMN